MFRKIYENLIHPGTARFFKIIKKYTNLPYARILSYQISKECETCNREKDTAQKYGVLEYENNTRQRNKCIAIDIKGPIKLRHFKTSVKERFFSILVVTDMFTRYTEIAIIFDTHAETIVNAIEKIWLSKHPVPLRCITDNGRQFLSAQFKNFIVNKNMEHILCAPNNPTGNSIVERVNKEIGVGLRLSRGMSLDKLLENIWRRINLNINTDYCPYELFYAKPTFENSSIEIKIDNDAIQSKLEDSATIIIRKFWNQESIFIIIPMTWFIFETLIMIKL
ncbi:hypothetical protein EQH57_0105 [Dictyocoela roeselum]|nr:hypothetical protein EQH57_0105 [Dictyocoela roeselum]